MSVRIAITAGGIYGADGKEVPVGTELTVKEEPQAWAGRYEVISDSKGKTPATNPKPGDEGLKAEHHGGGKFNITEGEKTLLTGLSKADADAFNALSPEDRKAFVTEKAKA